MNTPPSDTHTHTGTTPVSYTHLDVYKRQGGIHGSHYYYKGSKVD